MSPFYRKEGEILTELKGESFDMKVGEIEGNKVTVTPIDANQIKVKIHGDIIGIVETSHAISASSYESKPTTLERRGIIFESKDAVAQIVHKD